MMGQGERGERQELCERQERQERRESGPPVVRDGRRYLSIQNWYFGSMSRADATALLLAEQDGGVFLVRDSTTIQGDYVLCVREDNKVSHYIINRELHGYRIGDQQFPDLPSVLSFYKQHYLDTTPLVRPLNRKAERIVAKYNFEGNDPDDLPFIKGEVLVVLAKDEAQWWTAQNSVGQSGSVPVPYFLTGQEDTQPMKKTSTYARVKQARVPNAYDNTALRLNVGDIVRVTSMSPTGQWQGEANGAVGHFPFTHVQLIDSESGFEDGSS